MKSRVHPKDKTKYRVKNWASYDRALVRRGDITIWLSPAAIAAWEPDRAGTRGAQRKYSDLAIESALTLRLLFHLPLRQAEGFLTALFVLMGLDLRVPDHTTLSRRGRHLDLTLRRVPKRAGLHLIIDSSGLSIVGDGEWATAKHGRRGRRGWKKLHLGVDPTGVTVAHALTEATLDDATTGVDLIAAVNDDSTRVTVDAADDTVAFYDTASARGVTFVVPPAKTAHVSPRGPRSSVRDRTINTVKRIGRCRWKKTSRSQQQARVENAFVRCTSIIGEGLRAKTPGGRTAETLLACNITQYDDRHGPAELVRHGSVRHHRLGFCRSVSICAPTPRWRVWPCADEWHPAFRHAPAAGPGACPCSAASPPPSPQVPRSRAASDLLAWARAAAHRRAVSGHCRPRPRAGDGGPCAPYAVLRRTRRRGDAVRGLAGCERPRGACACCAR